MSTVNKREILERILGKDAYKPEPLGKVLNPLAHRAVAVILDDKNPMLEYKLPLGGISRKPLYLTEILPMFIDKEAEPFYDLVARYTLLLNEKVISILISDPKKYERLTNLMDKGLGIYRFYLELLHQTERNEVYSQYSSILVDTLYGVSSQEEKEVIMTQCLVNEPDRVFPTTFLVEPSRGLMMRIRMDGDKLDETNDLKLESIDQAEAYVYMLKSIILMADITAKGLDYFRLYAPMAEMVMGLMEITELG